MGFIINKIKRSIKYHAARLKRINKYRIKLKEMLIRRFGKKLYFGFQGEDNNYKRKVYVVKSSLERMICALDLVSPFMIIETKKQGRFSAETPIYNEKGFNDVTAYMINIKKYSKKIPDFVKKIKGFMYDYKQITGKSISLEEITII